MIYKVEDKSSALIIYCNDEFGGAERRLIRLYNEMGKLHNIELIVRGCDETTFLIRVEKADCNITEISKISYFNNNLMCLIYLFFSDFENIHYFDLCGFNIWVAKIMRFKHTRTLLTIAFQDYAYGLITDKVKKRLSKLINTTTKVDVLFPAGKSYLAEISNNNNITVTPGTFTKLDAFIPQRKEKLLLFAAARLEKAKNADLLLEACYLCKEELRRQHYKVVIAGKNFEENVLKTKIKKYQINDIIDMPGYLKISEIIPRVEMFFCLDLVDNYPSQTIAEAVACGCCLVCTDVGYSKMCGSKDFTYFVKNNCEDLAMVIEKYILKTDAEKKQIEISARKYAEEFYNIENSRKYFEKLVWGDNK